MAEDRQLFLLAAGRVGGVLKGPMQTIHPPWKLRAGEVSVAANGDDGFYVLIQELSERLGAMPRDVYADLGHDPDRQRMNEARRPRPGALYIKRAPCRPAQDAFGYLAAAGVAGAEDQNSWLSTGDHGADSNLLTHAT